MPLSVQQQKALDINRNISLNAGAGSGKTTVLIQRILHIIKTLCPSEKNGLKLSHIVAITFTEKAATELKERLLNAILSEIEEYERSKKNGDVLESLKYIYKQSNQSSISTIHAFCSKLIRQYAMFLNIDPNFTLLPEQDGRQLKEELVTSYLKDQLKQQNQHTIELYRLLGRAKFSSILFQLISEPQYLTETPAHTSREFWELIYKEELEKRLQNSHFSTLIPNILQFENQFTGNTETGYYKDNITVFFKTLRLFPGEDFQIIHTLKNALVSTKGELRSCYVKHYPEHAQTLFLSTAEELIDLASSGINEFNEHDDVYLTLFPKIHHEANIIFKQFQEIKRKRSVLDFNDLEYFTHQLLSKNDYVISLCKHHYRFFLIDEFQDTNLYQWKLLLPLLLSGSSLHQQKTFIVGDPKQSIYSFRGADVGVFKSVTTQIENECKYSKPYYSLESEEIEATETEQRGKLTLNDNYRTAPSQLHFINDVFKEIFRYKPSEFDVDFIALNPKKEAEKPHDIQMFIGVEDNLVSEYNYIVFHILDQINKGVPLKEIAILFRKRSDSIQELEQILNEMNIPYQNHLGQSFYSTEEVKDIYNVIKFCCYQDDDTALFGLLSSRFFNLDEDQLFKLRSDKKVSLWKNLYTAPEYTDIFLQLKQWVLLSKRVSPIIFLNELFNHSVYLEFIPEKASQVLANIEKCIGIIGAYMSSDTRDIFDIERYLSLQIENDVKEAEAELLSEELDNKVQLLTIHASKGLEFEVVILPHLNDDISPNYMFQTYFDRIHEEPIIYPKLSKLDAKEKGFIESFLKYRYDERSFAEEKRIFYVATTRVVSSLILSATIKPPKKETDEAKLNPKSYLTFLNHSCKQLFNKTLFPYQIDNKREIPTEHYTLHVSYSFSKTLQPLSRSEKIEQTIYTQTPIPSDSFYGDIFSATKLMTYLNDKTEYYKRYNLGLFDTDYDEIVESATGDSPTKSGALLGTIIHKLFEHIHLVKQPDNYINQLIKGIVLEPDDLALLKTQLNTYTHTFLTSDKTAFIRNASQQFREYKITLKIENNYFTGTLDLIALDGDEWKVIDYKTNAVTPINYKHVAKKYHIQMESYAFLLSKLFPDQHVFPVSLYFLQIDTFYTIRYTREELLRYETHLKETIKDIIKTEQKIYNISTEENGVNS